MCSQFKRSDAIFPWKQKTIFSSSANHHPSQNEYPVISPKVFWNHILKKKFFLIHTHTKKKWKKKNITTKNRLRSNFKLLAFFPCVWFSWLRYLHPSFSKREKNFLFSQKKNCFFKQKNVYISRDSTPFFFKYIDFF